VRFMVGRIRDMVLDILYYAKEKDLKWETVDVLGFAEEVLRTVGPKLKDQGITLSHRFDSCHRPFRGGCRHCSQRPDQHHRKCR
jgi:signal transduction histidine kinase